MNNPPISIDVEQIEWLYQQSRPSQSGRPLTLATVNYYTQEQWAEKCKECGGPNSKPNTIICNSHGRSTFDEPGSDKTTPPSEEINDPVMVILKTWRDHGGNKLDHLLEVAKKLKENETY
jgi:hypothetical protein